MHQPDLENLAQTAFTKNRSYQYNIELVSRQSSSRRTFFRSATDAPDFILRIEIPIGLSDDVESENNVEVRFAVFTQQREIGRDDMNVPKRARTDRQGFGPINLERNRMACPIRAFHFPPE